MFNVRILILAIISIFLLIPNVSYSEESPKIVVTQLPDGRFLREEAENIKIYPAITIDGEMKKLFGVQIDKSIACVKAEKCEQPIDFSFTKEIISSLFTFQGKTYIDSREVDLKDMNWVVQDKGVKITSSFAKGTFIFYLGIIVLLIFYTFHFLRLKLFLPLVILYLTMILLSYVESSFSLISSALGALCLWGLCEIEDIKWRIFYTILLWFVTMIFVLLSDIYGNNIRWQYPVMIVLAEVIALLSVVFREDMKHCIIEIPKEKINELKIAKDIKSRLLKIWSEGSKE